MLNSKKAVCDWIMRMTAEEYFDFMGSVSNKVLEEIFYSCSQCEKEHGEECEENGMDDLSKCFRFFREHYGIRGRDEMVIRISEPLTGIGRLLSRKADFIKELQEYADSRYPACHAANWSHIMKIRLGISEKVVMDAQMQKEIERIPVELKPIVENWLEYYIQNNDDGIYDAWLEQFWDGECPDDRTLKENRMIQIYEKYLKNGIIEEYYYGHAPEEIRKGFLNKWCQRYSVPYDQDSELNLYIGQRGKVGKFYCGHDEFFEPLEEPEKSDCWKLIKQILIAEF